MAEEPTLKEKEGDVKPAGHELLEEWMKHHKSQMEGVASCMPRLEPTHPLKEDAKKCCGLMHKAMCDLVGTHGKAYGLKMKEDDLPDEVMQERDPEEKPGVSDEAQDVSDKEDLPEDESAMEEDMTDDEAKAFEAQIKAMEDQCEQQDQLLEAAGLK
jgi:hypothetical protein